MKLPPLYQKLLFYSFCVLAFGLLCYFILGGSFSTGKEEVAATSSLPNLDLPLPQSSELSANRVEALQKQQDRQEQAARKEQAQNNSFDWLSSLSETPASSETASPANSSVEDASLSQSIVTQHSTAPHSSHQPSSGLYSSHAEENEAARLAALAAKRQRLEELLGVSLSDSAQQDRVNSENSSCSSITATPPSNVQKWEPSSSDGFYGLPQGPEASTTAIRAVVHGLHENLKRGSIVKFRLIDALLIDGTRIPANTFFYGIVSFSQGRALIHCENIQYGQKVYPFRGTVYDKDGFEGLYVPDNQWDETKRKVGADVLSATSLTLPSSSLIGTAANALTSAVQTAAQQAVRQQKLTISSNYQVLIQLKP